MYWTYVIEERRIEFVKQTRPELRVISRRRCFSLLIAEILEAVMLICFGLSWPMNAYKAYKARTAKGTSWQFLTLICAGYVCGIGAKLACGIVNWVLVVYFVNLVLLGVNWAVYFRNRRLDQASEGMCVEVCIEAAAR